jgi:hypothetical protein
MTAQKYSHQKNYDGWYYGNMGGYSRQKIFFKFGDAKSINDPFWKPFKK